MGIVQTLYCQTSRMSGYDLVNRNVLSRVRKVVRWRQRNLRWQAVPHLRASNRECSAADSGTVNRRLNEAVAAGRAKSSATWKVCNVGERAKVRWCIASEDLVYQDGIHNRRIIAMLLQLPVLYTILSWGHLLNTIPACLSSTCTEFWCVLNSSWQQEHFSFFF